MAIANHFVHVRKCLEARRERTERHEFRAFDPANLMLPGLAHINENQLLSAIHPRFHIRWRDFQFIHLLAPPSRFAFFEESKYSFPRIMALHQHRQVYAFRFFELLREIRKMETMECLARWPEDVRIQ